MHVISQRPLREFWQRHGQAEGPLRSWFATVTAASWENFEDLKSVYGAADRVGKFTIFDVGGNKWRIITATHYNRKMVFVRHVLTHEEYDRGKWKDG